MRTSNFALGVVSSSQNYFFVTLHRVRTDLGAHAVSSQSDIGALSSRVKQPGREAHHSPQFSVKVKNARSSTSTPQYVFMSWCLVKLRDKDKHCIFIDFHSIYFRFIHVKANA